MAGTTFAERKLDLPVAAALQRVVAMPTRNLCVEAIMKFDISFTENVPLAIPIAELDTIGVQPVFLKRIAGEADAKRWQVR